MSIFLKTKAQRGKLGRSRARLHLLKCSPLRHRPALGSKLLTPKVTHLPDSWSALGSLIVYQAWGSPSYSLPSQVIFLHLCSGTVNPTFKTSVVRPQVLGGQSCGTGAAGQVGTGNPYLTQQACQAVRLHCIYNRVLQAVSLHGGKVAMQAAGIQDGLEGLLVGPLCPTAMGLVAAFGMEG